MKNFKRLAILIIVFGFISVGWIHMHKVTEIFNFNSEVAAIIGDSLADYSKTTDIELIYVDWCEGDTNTTVISNTNVRTKIATTISIMEQNGWEVNSDSTALIYNGTDSIVAHIVVDVSILETAGSSDFEIYIGLNDTIFRGGIDRKVSVNDIGAMGSSRLFSMGANDSLRCFLKNETGTEDITVTHFNGTISGRKK